MSLHIFRRHLLVSLFALLMLGLVGSSTAFAQGYGRYGWRERQRIEEMHEHWRHVARMREELREQRIREQIRREARLRELIREERYREQMREARIRDWRERRFGEARVREGIRYERSNRGGYDRPFRRF